MKAKTIWIDLDNSPHIPFFYPIIKELQSRGYKVVITVRDYAQAIGLADLMKLDYLPLGKHYGKNVVLKGLGLVIRAFQILPFYLKHKPEISVSHGSRSQILFSSFVGLNNVIAIDYEFVKFFPFIKSSLGIMPEVLPEEFGRKYFKSIATYQGIKEDAYVFNFNPDQRFLEKSNLDEKKVLITVRPPATSAHYHDSRSDRHFRMAMSHICKNENVCIIMLPRTKEQGEEIRKEFAPWFDQRKIIIPDQVLDGLNLIWYSDLVISAGGTMIREAAALKVPAFSIFGGQIGAVDRYLEETGLLKVIRREPDIQEIQLNKRERPEAPNSLDNKVLDTIVNHLETLMNHD